VLTLFLDLDAGPSESSDLHGFPFFSVFLGGAPTRGG
jgi:hypothetical protein